MRVLVPTFRSFANQAFRGVGYEAQDVLAEVADVCLIELQPGPLFSFRERMLRSLAWHDFTGLTLALNPGLRPVRIGREFDLFVLICQHRHLQEVLYLNALKDWSGRCHKKVCIVDELWAYEVPRLGRYLKQLEQFDLVLVCCEGSVRPAAEVIGRPCRFLPPAVDTARFSPLPQESARCIDVCSIGRRREQLHRALCRIAERRNWFYFYDTSSGGNTIASDHRCHRAWLARIAQRSRCFMVAPALIDQGNSIRGQIEVPARYFEGAAAGAILLGERPACQSFDRLFDWTDTVVEVRSDGSDCEEVLAALFNDPSRCELISRRNVSEALRRHDWVYRWIEVVQFLGLAPTEAMIARAQRLHETAAAYESSASPANHRTRVTEARPPSGTALPRQ